MIYLTVEFPAEASGEAIPVEKPCCYVFRVACPQ